MASFIGIFAVIVVMNLVYIAGVILTAKNAGKGKKK
jgi:hypothetical protein